MTAMTLEEAVARLEMEGVPTDSFIKASQHVNAHLPTGQQATDRILAMTGEKVVAETDEHVMQLPLTYAYLVQSIVKAKIAKASAKLIDVLVAAKVSAAELVDKQAWLFIADEEARQDIENADPEVVKAGKAKKGARKVLALKIYRDQIEGKDLKRKEAIAILVEEVGLTQAGGSTYYANFKNGNWS